MGNLSRGMLLYERAAGSGGHCLLGEGEGNGGCRPGPGPGVGQASARCRPAGSAWSLLI